MLIVAYWQESERNAKCLCFDNGVCSAVTNHHVDMWQQLQLWSIMFDNAVGWEYGFKFICAEFVYRKDELYVHVLQGLVCSSAPTYSEKLFPLRFRGAYSSQVKTMLRYGEMTSLLLNLMSCFDLANRRLRSES